MKRQANTINKLQQGCVLSLAALGLLKLSCASAVAGNVSVSSDLSLALSKSIAISHIEPGKLLNVVLVLALKDPNGAAEFARRVSTPDDPLYGKFLSPEQFGAAFGPSDADYNTVRSWAVNNGLSINEISRSHTTLSVRGSAAQFEAIFGTRIDNYRGPDGRSFFSANSAPNVPVEIAGRLQAVIGLSSYIRLAPLVVRRPTQQSLTKPALHTDSAGGTGPGGAYSAADLRTAYSIPMHLSPAKTETVAVFEQGGFDPNDVKKYESENNLPDVLVEVRNVNGYRGVINDPNIELEAVLDIDMVIGVNPAIKEVQVYEDGDDPFGVALLDALAAMANDNTAQTISISYGTDEAIQGSTQIAAEGLLFEQLAAQGQGVLVSAGDDGAYGRSRNGLNVSDPGSQTYVTSVGGTSLFTGAGSVYLAEEVWNTLAEGIGASGGGVSSYWPIPAWQVRTLYPIPPGGIFKTSATPNSIATRNGGSSTMRNVPDLTAVANPLTGVAVYSAINGGWLQVGGTSVSAPVWGGYLSILGSARRILGLGKLGFLNPYLYYLALTSGSRIDIRNGSNGNANLFRVPGYNAGIGYDNCSGLGSIIGESFAFYSLTRHLAINGTRPSVPRGLSGTAATATANVSWTATPGATGYIVQAIRTGTRTLTNYVSHSDHIELTDLAPKTTYFIEVVAVNPNGANASGLYLTTR
jgi:subtilase family serine protease